MIPQRVARHYRGRCDCGAPEGSYHPATCASWPRPRALAVYLVRRSVASWQRMDPAADLWNAAWETFVWLHRPWWPSWPRHAGRWWLDGYLGRGAR